jgi:hypothetical protein
MFIDDCSCNIILIYEMNKYGYYLKAVIYRYGDIRRHQSHIYYKLILTLIQNTCS